MSNNNNKRNKKYENVLKELYKQVDINRNNFNFDSCTAQEWSEFENKQNLLMAKIRANKINYHGWLLNNGVDDPEAQKIAYKQYPYYKGKE